MKGSRITELRESKGLSQAELADLLGVNTATLSRWENCHYEPRLSVIRKMCEILDVSESEFWDGPTAEKRIEITLVFGRMEEKVRIDMANNKFQLFLGDSGEVGISGGGMFKSKEALKQFAADVLAQLEIGFDVQVRRGLIHEGE